jgi:hypothetical protein
VNSRSAKPGPKAALDRNLLVWESEWYWIFHGLVYGIPARNELDQDWEMIRPPKPARFAELNEERIAEWNAKTRTPEGWVPVTRRYRTRGRAAEPMIWRQILRARRPAQISAACRASPFWLNPKRNMRPWVEELEKQAKEFMVAKKYRYPGSTRPSSTEKRVLHFARAMAGITVGIGCARAIDVIRTMKHGHKCPCRRCENLRWTSLEVTLGLK